MSRRLPILWLLLPLLATLPAAGRSGSAEDSIRLEVEPREANVGDRLTATIHLDLGAESSPELTEIGPQLGPFEVVSGGWNGPTPEEDRRRWTWSGEISSFRTGTQEVPSVTLRIESGGETREISSTPVPVEILSLLDEEESGQSAEELADLKPPASIAADYRTLWGALGLLALLFFGAALLWWLQRRYAARLAAARIPDDPFHRTPPHVWVYRELQKLLERRLEEDGNSLLFYSELSRILKRYLGGRYRIDLMDQTSAEVPVGLEQAGAPQAAIQSVDRLLADCDLVKFARLRPDPGEWREAVERAYGIVDATKPVESPSEANQRGAA
jgi:hypothetical protein